MLDDGHSTFHKSEAATTTAAAAELCFQTSVYRYSVWTFFVWEDVFC
jgi:hypothetical protein